MFKKASIVLSIFCGILLGSSSFAQTEDMMSSFPELEKEVDMFNEAGGLEESFCLQKKLSNTTYG